MPESPAVTDVFSGFSLERGVSHPLSDGTRLVADIYRPATPGPHPVLLMRQPYGRDIASTVVYAHPSHFARAGFVVVIEDVRGRGDSDGAFNAFAQEGADGVESIAWVKSLPGTTGEVGMYGFSYQAYTQLAAASTGAGLTALAPHMGAHDLYGGWFYRNGILQLATTLSWANQMLREDARRSNHPAYGDLETSWQQTGRLATQFPLRQAKPITAEGLPAYGREWIEHDCRDGFWAALDQTPHASGPLDLPQFHVAGWFDFYFRGTLAGYEAQRQADCRHRDDQLIVIGPWIHIPWGTRAGDWNQGEAAKFDTDALLVEFMKSWLTKKGEGAPRGCHYFSLGEKQWIHAPAWPPPGTRAQKLFLGGKGRANSRFGGGTLEAAPPAETIDDLFNYDPEVPVAAPGGNLGGTTRWGSFDLSAQQEGNNLLVYTAPPVERLTRFAGRPTLFVQVATTAVETDLVARLSLVTASGQAWFLTLGATPFQGRGAAHFQEVVLELDDIAFALQPGESLRLDLAGSAFPLLARNPNTGANRLDLKSPADFRRALIFVRSGLETASYVTMPEVCEK